MKPGLKDYARYFLRRAVHGAGWLVLWAFWLALALALYTQARIATSDEIAIPDAVLRSVEQRLAAQGLKLTFGSIQCDTAGNVVLRDVALFSGGFDDPIVTVRAARCTVNPYGLLVRKIVPQAMRIDGGSLRLPAMFSSDGANSPVIAGLDADVELQGDTLLVKDLSARLENLTLLFRGGVTLPRSGLGEKTDTQLLAEGIAEYLKIARQVAALAPKLKTLERPILDVTLTPDAEHMALARVTLTADSLRVNTNTGAGASTRTDTGANASAGAGAGQNANAGVNASAGVNANAGVNTNAGANANAGVNTNAGVNANAGVNTSASESTSAGASEQLAVASGPLLAATSFDFGMLANAFEKSGKMDASAGSGGLQTAGRGATRLAIEKHSDAQNQKGRDFVASGGLETAPPSYSNGTAAPPLRLDVFSESVQFAQTARARGVRLALTLPLAEASQLLQHGASAPALDVLLRVTSDSVTAHDVTARAFSANISGQFPKNLRAEAEGELFATPVSLDAAANLDDKSATLAIATQVTPRHIAEISRIAAIDLGAILKPARPIAVEASARLDAGWHFASASGDVEAGAIFAYGVQVDRARGTFAFDNAARTITFSPALAVVGESAARGSFTTNLGTGDYRFLLKGDLRPPDITPWLGAWWADFWKDFNFTGPAPFGDVDVQGRWKNPGRSRVFIGADAARLAYNKVAFDRALLTLFVKPDFIDVASLLATRGDGSASGSFTYDTRGGATTTTLNFTAKNIDPVAVAPAISPDVAEGLAQLKFDKPLSLIKAAGRISEKPASPGSPDWRHARLDIDAEGDGAFTYARIPLTGLSARITMRDDDVVFERLETRIAGGRLNASAQAYGPPDGRRLGFALTLTQADLGNIIGLARAYATSGTAAVASAKANANANAKAAANVAASANGVQPESISERFVGRAVSPKPPEMSGGVHGGFGETALPVDITSGRTRANANATASANQNQGDNTLEKQLAGGLLDVRLSADGLASDWLSFQGAGSAEVTGANLLNFHVLGALSQALSSVRGLNFTTISANAGQARFGIDGARVNVPEAVLTGSRALIKLNGDYSLATRYTNITARVYPLSASRNAIGRGLGILLVPFSRLTELKFSGPIESPSWRFSYGPTSLFRALSGKPSDGNADENSDGNAGENAGAPASDTLVPPPALEPAPEAEPIMRIFGQPQPLPFGGSGGTK